MNVVKSSKESRYPNLIPYVVFVGFLNALFVAFCFFAFWQSSHYKRDFKVDAEMFEHSVSNAVFGFMSTLVDRPSSNTVSSSSSSSPFFSSPALVRVSGLGFANSPRYGNYFVLDGCTFREGDFCEYGLVVSVGSDRAFCDSDKGLVIIRPVYPDIKNDWYASGRGDGNGVRPTQSEDMQKHVSDASPDGVSSPTP